MGFGEGAEQQPFTRRCSYEGTLPDQFLRIALSALLLFAGISKVVDDYGLYSSLMACPEIPAYAATPLTLFATYAEVVLGSFLLLGLCGTACCWVASGLFAAYFLFLLRFRTCLGLGKGCGCLGSWSPLGDVNYMICLDIMCSIAAAFVALRRRPCFGLDHFWRGAKESQTDEGSSKG